MAIPQGPWNNPTIPAGIYDAEIRYLADGKYHGKKDRYIQVVMWLPQVQDYFVSNLVRQDTSFVLWNGRSPPCNDPLGM